MSFLRRNIDEISRDRALRFYGAALAFLHVLAFLNWETLQPLSKIFDPSQGPLVCWPFFEDCGKWRMISPHLAESILRGYVIFALATVILFFQSKNVSRAWVALLFLNILKSIILFQDYRLRLNQHYMTFAVTFAFLFIPGKRQVLRYLIVSFYFWAGTLKFTPDWISGAGLYGKKPLGVPEVLIPASCVYVIFLELIIVFGLLARNRWIFWISFAQIIAFHIASWSVVDFFYPTLMLGILSIFLLARYIRDPLDPNQDPPLAPNMKKFFLFREPVSVYAMVGMFAIIQLLPYSFPGDQSFTGEGRLLALHMFDAPLQCMAWATIRFADGRKQEMALRTKFLTPRIQCDPNVYFSLGKDLCRRIGKDKRIETIDLHLQTRRTANEAFTPVIEQADFCHKDLHYDLWRSNAWILK